MNTKILPKFLTFVGLFIMLISLQANAAIKCWTNNEGIRECGNRVPPEFAQQGHQEISESGMVIEEQSRAKTKAELAEDAKQKALLAEKKRKQAEQKRTDNILLATF